MRVARIGLSDGTCVDAWKDADGTFRRLEIGFQGLVRTDERIEGGVLLTPVEPRAIYAVGLNYTLHAEESGSPLPEYPMVFMKAITAARNPGASIQLPRHLRSDEVDYEAELAIVIGRRCKNVSAAEALDHVLGFTCANDVSARDWQIRKGGGQFCRGKTFDTFCPLGPELVTVDEIGDGSGLRIQTRVNGEVLQDSNTSDMIFPVPQLISFLSGSTTLLPGTVILTGTPSGVGVARRPQRFLQPGDQVEVEIGGIGILSNPVEEEPVQGSGDGR